MAANMAGHTGKSYSMATNVRTVNGRRVASSSRAASGVSDLRHSLRRITPKVARFINKSVIRPVRESKMER